jgi:heat shock protein HslJ
MTQIKTPLLLVLVSLLITACAPAPNELTGTSWVLVSLDGNTQVGAAIGGQPVTLAFSSETEAGGSGGCNGFGAKYQANVSTGAISFSDLVSTLMACLDSSVMELEGAYFTALNAAETYSVSGTRLTIRGGGTLVFARQ